MPRRGFGCAIREAKGASVSERTDRRIRESYAGWANLATKALARPQEPKPGSARVFFSVLQ